MHVWLERDDMLSADVASDVLKGYEWEGKTDFSLGVVHIILYMFSAGQSRACQS